MFSMLLVMSKKTLKFHNRWIPATLAAVLLSAVPAVADLGWEQADYVKNFGQAAGSSLAPDQVRFSGPRGASLIVRFADGHSIEELWIPGEHSDTVPAALREEAESAIKGAPQRRVDFHLKNAVAVEIFETHNGELTLNVDRRAGKIVHIGRCRGKCILLDQVLGMQIATDNALWRAEQQRPRQLK